MFTRALFIVGALAASALADFEIIVPGGDNLWWVANSENNIIWNCKDSPVDTFTIQLTNSDQNILVAPLSIVASQDNFDCSRTLDAHIGTWTPAKNYKVQFSNPINSTEVYTQSDFFEIKAEGSAYPDASATPTSDSTASASGSASGSSSDAAATSASAGVAQTFISPSAFGAMLMGILGMLAL